MTDVIYSVQAIQERMNAADYVEYTILHGYCAEDYEHADADDDMNWLIDRVLTLEARVKELEPQSKVMYGEVEATPSPLGNFLLSIPKEGSEYFCKDGHSVVYYEKCASCNCVGGYHLVGWSWEQCLACEGKGFFWKHRKGVKHA